MLSLTLLLIEQAPAPSPFGGMAIPIALMFTIFWFVVIAPERKQRRAREEMLAALKKGDEVLTNGGMLGKVTQVQDDTVTLQVADGVRMRFLRSAVASLRERGAGEAS